MLKEAAIPENGISMADADFALAYTVMDVTGKLVNEDEEFLKHLEIVVQYRAYEVVDLDYNLDI